MCIRDSTMRANKHLHRLALIVRKENPNIKTKIHIPSGELHPILSVKHQGEDEYNKIDERTLENAKGIYIAQSKAEVEKRKKEKDGLLSTPMDLGPGVASGNPR